jgi:hypothetical protein
MGERKLMGAAEGIQERKLCLLFSPLWKHVLILLDLWKGTSQTASHQVHPQFLSESFKSHVDVVEH